MTLQRSRDPRPAMTRRGAMLLPLALAACAGSLGGGGDSEGGTGSTSSATTSGSGSAGTSTGASSGASGGTTGTTGSAGSSGTTGSMGACPNAATSWSHVTTGSNFTCAIDIAGGAWCWGANDTGQLGQAADGTTHPCPEPVAIAGKPSWSDLDAGGNHACGVIDSGLMNGLWCWGDNTSGQLGLNTTTNWELPTKTAPNTPIPNLRAVAAGGRHTCALDDTGAPFCWGANDFGQVGADNANDPTVFPMGVQISLFDSPVAALGAGKNHTCAIVEFDQHAYCWGDDLSDQLGIAPHPMDDMVPIPTAMQGSVIWSTIDGGGAFTCGITSVSLVNCVGDNQNYQIGDGTNGNRSAPTATGMNGSFAATQLSAGGLHTCAVTPAKEVYCWGANFSGQIGNGMMGQGLFAKYPTAVAGGWSDWVQVAAGGTHSCGLRESGELYCWGNNADGQLGDGSTDASASPVRVGG